MSQRNQLFLYDFISSDSVDEYAFASSIYQESIDWAKEIESSVPANLDSLHELLSGE